MVFFVPFNKANLLKKKKEVSWGKQTNTKATLNKFSTQKIFSMIKKILECNKNIALLFLNINLIKGVLQVFW